MVFEYEFRLVVRGGVPTILDTKPLRRYRVMYAHPHFRYRNGKLETKTVLSQQAVYHDGSWFRFVESEETPFERWNRSTHIEWMRLSTHFQNPFAWEDRIEWTLGKRAKLYYALDRRGDSNSNIVFECEWGVFQQRRQIPDDLEALAANLLPQFQNVYGRLMNHPFPPYTLTTDDDSRKPVTNVTRLPTNDERYLYAHKHDGTFCTVHSHPDRLVVRTEENRFLVLKDKTLGDGFVFAGERLRDGTIVLLDVYQVRGVRTALSRRHVLTDFLPSLSLPNGFAVQEYANQLENLPPTTERQTDGFVCHDVVNDRVYKFKFAQTIDAVYWNGRFELANGKTMVPNNKGRRRKKAFENGRVYEISIDGDVLRRRRDRFVGNTVKQLKNIHCAVSEKNAMT